jgi:hypothetical protein
MDHEDVIEGEDADFSLDDVKTLFNRLTTMSSKMKSGSFTYFGKFVSCNSDEFLESSGETFRK